MQLTACGVKIDRCGVWWSQHRNNNNQSGIWITRRQELISVLEKSLSD